LRGVAWPEDGRSGARDDPYDEKSDDPPEDPADEPDDEEDPADEDPDDPELDPESPPRGAADPVVSLPPLGRDPACPAHAGVRLNAKAAATVPIVSF
jgi:hypothetical protein